MNYFCGIGRLTNQPEIRYTTKDLAIARFNIAIRRTMPNKDGNYDADFINCFAYGKTAELIGKYLDKGSSCGIEGRIQTGSYEKDGKKIYTTDVAIDKIQFLDTKKKEETQTEIVQKAMSDNPYENFGQQIQMDNEGLPF